MGLVKFVVCACLLLAVHITPVISAPPDDDGQVHATTGAASWHWTPDEWTATTKYREINGYADRPDAQSLNDLTVEWQETELDALGNFCTVRGRIGMTDKNDSRIRPVNWFQGVTVYLEMTPGDRPDWSGGMDRADTVHETAVTSPSGTFRVCFDLRKTKYDRDQPQSFQFGVALARHKVRSKTSHHVEWNSRAPAVPSSIRILTIPAAPRLSRELELINRASRWPFSNPDGVALIRAVNSLRPLGKERSLAVLENYLELTHEFGYFSDQGIVFWIIRLLFEPIRLDDRIPEPGIAVSLVGRKSAEAQRWPLISMALSADIPFMVGHEIGLGGVPEHPSAHIRWARLHGAIRDGPLEPAANPLAAAEAILSSRRFQDLDDFGRTLATRAIRSQALAMVEGILRMAGERENIRDDQWKSLLEAAANREIHWDDIREQFVTRE